MIHKIAYLLSTLIIFFGFCLLFYWTYFPQQIITYPKTENLKVIPKQVIVGSNLAYELSYCKLTNTTSTVYHTLVGTSGNNHTIFTLASIMRSIPIGCKSVTLSDIFIPETVPPGTYFLAITVEYHPNPLRIMQYFLTTENFEVSTKSAMLKEGE